MDLCAGKRKRTDNENNRESQMHKFRISTARERGKRKKFQYQHSTIDDLTTGKAHFESNAKFSYK